MKLIDLKSDYLPLLLLLLIPLFFLAELFTAPFKIFFPADFLLSDLIHVNLAQKAFLSNSLRLGQWPLITPLLAHGFPLLAESQIGALNIFNILLYKMFSVPLAFNLTYLLGFIWMNWSMYYLVKYLCRNTGVALFSSVSWFFSGIVMQEIVHQGVLQGIFLLPTVLLLIILCLDTKSYWLAILASFFASQQFLFGHFFVSVGINFFLSLLFLWFWFYSKPDRKTIVSLVCLYFAIFLLIIAPQLVQSFVYTQFSNRATTAGGNLLVNTFELPYLLTFVAPFPFGSFRFGDFFRNAVWKSTSTIPWEATIYLGYAVIIALLVLIKERRRLIPLTQSEFRRFRFFLACTAISFLLMFGTATPLKLFFSLPIVSSFRIVVRFSIFTSFFLLLAFSYSFIRVSVSKKWVWIFIAIQIVGGFFNYYQYFPKIEYRRLIRKPQVAKMLSERTFYEFGTAINWFETFSEYGYGALPAYQKYRNSNYPFLNLLYGTNSCGLFRYSNYNPANYSSYVATLDQELGRFRSQKLISDKALSLLQLLGCEVLVSPLNFRNLKLLNRFENYRLFEVTNPLPKVLFKPKVNTYFSQSHFDYLIQEKHIRMNDQIYAKELLDSNHGKHWSKISTITNQSTYLKFRINTSKAGYLQIRRLKYPGWTALVDQTPSPIYEAARLYMLVKIPAGNHTLELHYQPPFWQTTFWLSCLGYLVSLMALGFGIFRPRKDILEDHDNKRHITATG